MAIIEAFLRRPIAILKIPDAIARGLSPTAWIKELTSLGLSYRRANMLADFRSVAGTEARKGLLKYVRKDYIPNIRTMANVTWDMSREYMYKLNVWTQTRPGEVLVERQVNIMTNKAMTIGQVEQELYTKWGTWEKYEPEQIQKMEVIGAWHKVEMLEEPTPSPFLERD